MSNTVHLEHIQVAENRIRREFDESAIEELANSIASKGLMHPPVLDNDHRTLIAGERRTRAMRLLHESERPFRYNGEYVEAYHIPYSVVGDLSPLDIREAELEENVIREDLTWQEHAAAVRELHDLRRQQRAARDETQRLMDTATEIIGRSATSADATSVRDDILLAEALDDADVASAPDKKTAMKVLRRKREAEHRAKLAEQFNENLAETSHIRQGDAFTLIRQVEDAVVDVIITDPPYGVDASAFGGQASARHEYDDDGAYAIDCYTMIFAEANRVTRHDAFVFVFCDINSFPLLTQLAGEVLSDEWRVWATPLIWHKSVGMLPVPAKGPRRTYEAIVYAYRGSAREWSPQGTPDVILDIPGIQRPTFGAQKPPSLYHYLLSKVVRPGDVVLDPFAGAGPVVEAARALNCTSIAFERDTDKINYMKQQLTLVEAEPAT